VELPLNLPEELYPSNLEAIKKEVDEIKGHNPKRAKDLSLYYKTRIDFYIPNDLKEGEKRPAILVSSILGGTMVVDHFARYYAGRGYIAVLVHRKRIYWNGGDDLSEFEDYMRAQIIRLRQAIDWLENQPEVDSQRIGAFGISYGAILHTILAAVDDRVRYHVLAMPAGPLPDVIIHCPDRAIEKLVEKAQREKGWSKDEIYEKLKEAVKTDPIYLAPYVNKEKVQVYIALFDRVVGASRSWKLWRAMNKPQLKILPFGHYGGILFLPLLQTQSYAAFKKHLK